VSSIAIFGVGGVGSLMARSLAAAAEIRELVLFARNPDRLQAEAMDLRIAAENAGNERFKVREVPLDLANEDEVAAVLVRTAPDVIVHATTMRSWFTIASALPAATWKNLYSRTRFGPWLPINLAPSLRLMKAIRAAGTKASVVNVCFPDAVNPILARMGLAPTTGAGNSEIISTVLRISAAEVFGTDVADVAVRLIGHHFHLANLDYDVAWSERPFWYRIFRDGRDVTAELDSHRFQERARRNCPHRSSVPAAMSAAKNVRRLLGADAGAIVHCSAPNGMEGGYDVRFEDCRPKIELPPGISLADATGIAREASVGEGIEEILPDGGVRFCAAEAEAMHEGLGYDCRVLRPAEIEERGRELLARFDELVAREVGSHW
jgi:hypothetical protein